MAWHKANNTLIKKTNGLMSKFIASEFNEFFGSKELTLTIPKREVKFTSAEPCHQ